MKQIIIYLKIYFIMMILVIILILISVAFLTLLERKMLSYIQIRKGPNKVGFNGILQPFSDAIKLMSKELVMLKRFNYWFYMLSPIFMLLLIMMLWLVYPFVNNMISFEMGVLYLILCLSLSVYGFLISGWSSNSSYSMLGSIRSLAQTISYEVNLTLIIFLMVIMIESFNFNNFNFIQINMWFMFYLMPLMLIMFFCLMAELNRAPFDFSEGESELVSGFNVEYGSSGFVLIFLSEYASILFMSFLMVLMYIGYSLMSLMFYIMVMLMTMIFIWLRGTFPRFRYDFLMYLCWLLILPFVLNYMIFIIIIKMLI